MDIMKLCYDMAEKLRPYAEPYMDETWKEAANSAFEQANRLLQLIII